MSFVTFVIPSLNRSSLKRTLTSLVHQLDSDWNAIVVYDGILPTTTVLEGEKRVEHLFVSKQEGGAGIVRNVGLDKVTSEWVAFVDDDDYLDPHYISRIKYYAPNYDLIDFTYRDMENGNTQPPANLNHLVSCNFGISFSVKTKFMNDNHIRFTPGGVEDYRFLQECLDKGANWIITHEIIYYVGHRNAWGTN
jgi:glycosyltransferase involved in cell wall biosynthesis